MKIAIVVGHNARAQGAVRVTDGKTEYHWNTDLAELIRDHDPDSIRIFRRVHQGSYSREIDRVYSEVDKWGADCSVELHFNSASSSAHGCETLSSGTKGSLALAGHIQTRMKAALGARDRGVKTVSKGGRGGRSLWAGQSPAALIEPYFGSHTASCHTADECKDQLAEAIFEGAKAFCTQE